MTVTEVDLVKTYDATAKDYPMRQRGRIHHGFLYTELGSEGYRFAGREIVTAPHSLLYIPKGAAYLNTLESERSVVTAIDFEIAGEGTEPFYLPLSDGAATASCFADAKSKWERAAGYLSFCKADLYKIAALAEAFLAAKDGTGNDPLAGAERLLLSRYYEPDFRVADLYREAGVSPKYFGTLFARRYGMTPKEYLILLRVERAKKLLENEKNTLEEVASAIGYADVYHFSKVFKAKTGITPAKYRGGRR